MSTSGPEQRTRDLGDIEEGDTPLSDPHQAALAEAARLMGDPTSFRRFLGGDIAIFSDTTDLLLRGSITELRELALAAHVTTEQLASVEHRLGLLLELLRRCREAGLESAFSEFEADQLAPGQLDLCPAELSAELVELASIRQRYALHGDPEVAREALARIHTLLASAPFKASRMLFRLMMIDDASNIHRDVSIATAQPRELDAAVKLLVDSVSHTPPDSPDFALRQLRLAGLLRERFDLGASIDDFAQGTDLLDRVLRNEGLHVEVRWGASEALAFWLRRGYREGLGEKLLSREIEVYEITLCWPQVPDQESARVRINLADALRVRCQETGGAVGDLDRAVDLLEAGLLAMPPSPGRVTAQVNLGVVLVEKEQRTGTTTGLERAVDILVAAAADAQCPERDRRRVAEAMATAASLLQRTGEVDEETLHQVEKVVESDRLRLLIDEFDPARQARANGRTRAQETAGERLLSQNRWMRREVAQLRRAELELRVLIVIVVLVAMALAGLLAALVAFTGGIWRYGAGLVLALALVTVLYKGSMLALRQHRHNAYLRAGIVIIRAPIASWTDDAARRVIDESVTYQAPFGVYLRAFETAASDRSLDLDEAIGPTYMSMVGHPVSGIERKLAALASETMPFVALANPADLMAPVIREGVPRLVVPEQEWQRYLNNLLDSSSIVVMECPEFSPGVVEELNYLISSGHQGKTLIVIPEEDSGLGHALRAVFSPGLSASRPPTSSQASSWFESFPHVISESELSLEAIKTVVPTTTAT